MVSVPVSSGSSLAPRVARRLKRDTKRLRRLIVGTTPTLPVQKAHDIRRTEVKPESSFDLLRPAGFNDEDWRIFSAAASGRIGASHVVEIDNGYIFGRDSWPMTAKGKALTGLWIPPYNIKGDAYNIMGVERFDRAARARATRLPGTSVTLNQMGGTNYFHFIFHCLPRLVLIQERVGLDDVDHFIVPADLKGFMQQWLAMAGIPDHKIRPMAPEGYACERLLVTDNPGACNIPPPWVIEYLNGLVPFEPDTAFPKRLFVTRNDSAIRKLLNLDEIEPLLRDRGFEPVTLSGRSVIEQTSLFRQAEAIVGVHGAALANLAFASPGTKMIELLPKNHLEPSYYFIGQQRQLDYTLLLGRETPLSIARWRRNMMADLSIDPDRLTASLDAHGL